MELFINLHSKFAASETLLDVIPTSEIAVERQLRMMTNPDIPEK
jgi:hypothetical protein